MNRHAVTIALLAALASSCAFSDRSDPPAPTYLTAAGRAALYAKYPPTALGAARARLAATSAKLDALDAKYRERLVHEPEERQEQIRKHEICLGMPAWQVWLSLGRPSDTNTTEDQHGTRSQWVYGEDHYIEYVYFENGLCTAWQN